MIPDNVVEEVRARADIVGIIGEFVQLKKAGKDFRGLSPFKDEKTPSFYVVPAKAFFHDFSSGESGDVFSFLMKHQGMSFVDAVKYVGARSGVDVREVRRGKKGDDPWRPYYEASAFAGSFFRERLWEWDGGKAAREYLEKRGIGREVGERFGIGYAPDEWEAFREAASVHGLDEGMLLELGLIKRSEGRDRPYDAFRN
ncbi:MAG: CHC2 zinc finger domain-containing protein, partial [Gemmatimonadota bacterium]|nr:CHC2 zinc finger domain-containing protein [Gemmatimonadota bacterium]